MTRTTPDKPVVIEGEPINKCPGCRALVIWEDETGHCVHCDADLDGPAGKGDR